MTFLSVYGHVSIDQIISVNEFPKVNTSVDALSKEVKLGGIATNISVRASSMGVPTAVCAFVGNDFPEDFERFMEHRNVIMDEFIKIDGEYTSTAFITNNSRMDQTVCFLQGAQGCASALGMDLLRNARSSEAVHFSTGDPDYYIHLMEQISEAKITFDPSQEIHDRWDKERFVKALGLSDRLFCNEHEAESVIRYMNVDSLSKIKKELIVCTLGEKGSEAYFDGKRASVPFIRPKKVVDPTGAGDAYRAGFYAALYRKYDVMDALTIASSSASFAVETVGALTNIPSWDQVIERAEG